MGLTFEAGGPLERNKLPAVFASRAAVVQRHFEVISEQRTPLRQCWCLPPTSTLARGGSPQILQSRRATCQQRLRWSNSSPGLSFGCLVSGGIDH